MSSHSFKQTKKNLINLIPLGPPLPGGLLSLHSEKCSNLSSFFLPTRKPWNQIKRHEFLLSSTICSLLRKKDLYYDVYLVDGISHCVTARLKASRHFVTPNSKSERDEKSRDQDHHTHQSANQNVDEGRKETGNKNGGKFQTLIEFFFHVNRTMK